MEERLQKILAQGGLGSRRDCEEYIVAGRVRVNGVVAIIGQKADPSVDKITLDGRLIKPAEQKVYVALNKPKYVLSTVDAEQGDTRQTVRDLVPADVRLYPVGRLDFESEGLILMTNDGDLAQKLTHPSHGHSKEYRVLLARQPDSEQVATWQRGVVLEDGYKTQKAEVRIESLFGKGAWMRIIMREGRKRQIREIGAMLGLPVARIIRIRIGTLWLGTLKSAEWRYLTPQEVKSLQEEMPGINTKPISAKNVRLRKTVKTAPKTTEKKPGRTPPPSTSSGGPGKPSPRPRPSGTDRPKTGNDRHGNADSSAKPSRPFTRAPRSSSGQGGNPANKNRNSNNKPR